KVQKGIRLFNKLFIERAEGLWQHISYLNALADDIDKFHRKAKIAAITGGTTSAVGGVATITGLMLAPLTLGTSLVVTAVGLGVVAAGGIASTTATISDTVHNSQDRKKAEKIVEDYQKKMVDLSHSLRFIHQGIGSLQKYDIGSGRPSEVFPSHAAHVRQATQMADAAGSAARAVQIAAGATGLLASLFVGMDVYFVAKDKQDLKLGDKSEYAAKVREATRQLHSGLIELNAIREELQS
uniref:Apolipoprotein L, 1 n=1 Tax=Lepisosteus oculatus TaxID=7918 RepID=W5M3L0_LEPOC